MLQLFTGRGWCMHRVGRRLMSCVVLVMLAATGVCAQNESSAKALASAPSALPSAVVTPEQQQLLKATEDFV